MLKSLNQKYRNDRFAFVVAGEDTQHAFKVIQLVFPSACSLCLLIIACSAYRTRFWKEPSRQRLSSSYGIRRRDEQSFMRCVEPRVEAEGGVHCGLMCVSSCKQGSLTLDSVSQFVDAVVGGGKRWVRLTTSPSSLLS